MANVNRLNGFTPVGYLNGADWDGRGRVYAIPSGNSNALFVGDPVTLIAGADSTYYLPCIDQGVGNSTTPNVGVILAIGLNPRGLGPWVDPTNLNNILFRPASTTKQYYALVADDPNTVFEVQEQASSGAGTNFTQTSANKNCQFAFGTPGQPPYYSAAFIDNGTAAATTATKAVKLLGLVQSIDNAPGAYQRWWCLLNQHYYRTGVVGI